MSLNQTVLVQSTDASENTFEMIAKKLPQLSWTIELLSEERRMLE